MSEHIPTQMERISALLDIMREEIDKRPPETIASKLALYATVLNIIAEGLPFDVATKARELVMHIVSLPPGV